MEAIDQKPLQSRLKEALRPAYQNFKKGEFWVRSRFGAFQPESKIAKDAQRFWNNDDPRVGQFAHWRGAGIFSDEKRWLSLGAEHFRLYEDFARMVGRERPLNRVLEWGCGGGANAIHFAPNVGHYVGLDVAQATLDECARTLRGAGFNNFTPFLIDASDPERARSLASEPFDLVLSTYVFELMPTPDYGLRVLEIMRDLLVEGGLAIINIRYVTNWASKSKGFDYRVNFVTMTTYAIEGFWSEAQRRGFTPKAVTLVPKQPLNEGGDYAYFLLQKN